MPIFPVNPQRLTPYDNTRFRVKWDGIVVPAITRVSGLGRVTQITNFRDGAAASMILVAPGINTCSPITVERGRTQDMTFENWNNLVWKVGAGAGTEVDLKNMRKDIRIELMNEAGQLVMAWNVFRCWPSEYRSACRLGCCSAGRWH